MMSNKKKPRKIKKNKGKKQSLDVLLTTSKDKFANPMIANQKKFKLFTELSFDEIEQILFQYGISITREDIYQEYEKTYNLDHIVDKYYQQYKVQLDEIDKLNTLLDGDCIILYIQKAVKDHYQTNQLPDPDMIVLAIESMNTTTDKNKPKYFLTLLQTINQLKNYREERNMEKLFAETFYDIEAAIDDTIALTLHNIHPSLEISKAIFQEVMTMIHTYEFNYPEYLCSDALELIASHGYQAVEKDFRECLKLFPNNKVRFYNAILSEIELYSKNSKDKKDFMMLYNEALALDLDSKDDKEMMNIIKENYSDFI